MEGLVAVVIDLFFCVLELIWLSLTKVLPATFYFTSIVLVPAATFGRVVVAYPKTADEPYRSWQKSPQGRIVLSPVLGNAFGFSFWVIVAVVVTIASRHA